MNGLADRITVSIDGAAPFTLRPHAIHELTIAEGSHVAKISGAHTEEIFFDIREKYFSRWFSDPAWVLNPGGAALLLHEAVTYAKNPIPPIYSFHFGNSFERFREITHPFQSLPDTIKLPSGSQGVLKTRLSEFREPVSEAFAYLTGENQRADALRLAELFLQRQPTNEDLLDAYVSEIYTTKDFQRALPLLESGLAYRPVPVEWHRTYQSFVEEVHPETNILALYDDFLAKEPTNSALIYLRGRLLESNDESIAEFQRALVLNPTNAYALNALGYNSSAHADWARAKKYFSQAVALDPKNDAFWSLYCQSKLALAEYDSMEIELRERLKTEPHFVTAILLIQLLASQNKAQQAEAEVTALVAHAGGDSPEMKRKLLTPLQRVVAYCSGDFNQLQVLSTNEPTQLHVALVEQNRLAEAEANLPEDFATRQDPFAPVAFGLAWNLAGDPKKGNEWISRGLKLLENGSKDERAVARLLRKTEAPADRELWELTVSPRERAIVAALLRFQHPAESGRFAQWIKRFNVEPIYPYHLLNRIVTRSVAAK